MKAIMQPSSVLLLLWLSCVSPLEGTKPNFVLIMVDDLGIGDLGCYGNTTLRTPNIDQLAQEGVKLTHHIAAASLCTPSRAAFLTGRYPIRSGVAGYHRPGVFLFNAASGGLPSHEITFANIAKQQGYKTALIGKWHLGLNCESSEDHCHHPSVHGFDYFFGIPLTNLRDCRSGHGTVFQFHKYIPYRALAAVLVAAGSLCHVGAINPRGGRVLGLLGLAALVTGLAVGFVALMPYLNCVLMRNHLVVEQPFASENLTQRTTREAVDFLERNSAGPLLLFFSFIQVHTAMFASAAFRGTSRHGIYGDAVHEVDWSVAGKSTNWEGGIRVPGILRWPGNIPSGREVDEPTSNMDLFPTLVRLSGASVPVDREIDGRDLVDLLQGRVERPTHEFLFHYCNIYLNAVRWHPQNSSSVWKAFYFTPNFYPENETACFHTHTCFCSKGYVTYHDPPLLFDLTRDPSESTPLTPDKEPAFHSVLAAMEAAVEQHRRSVEPVESQMSWWNLMWKPWLQPCCSTLAQLCQCERDEERGDD
uniref:Steroid sulfatase (microsomal), isozyme S n=1 Tax=Gasterosteus aculeatus aculeatus TaxID=481459 RepID=A0AAQ4PDJ8_GASAC